MCTVHLMEVVCGQTNKMYRSFEALLQNDFRDLRVTYSIALTKWITVTVSGPDEKEAAARLVRKYDRLHDVRPGVIVRARLADIHNEGLSLHAARKTVLVPHHRLKPLGRGTVRQVASRFGLIRCLPLEVKLVGEFDAEFTKKQIDTFWRWKKGPDRINVNNASRAQIKSVLKHTGHARDIYAIEKLGILEHSIVCKKGTDAPGLVPIIGPMLESELGCVRGAL
ncbi:MAG TPA: DUF2110 family protein [Candidatus Acidoferrales bacterium]|nr:DUF2110 family protein [Candidatus Acidoferrales bacterium]